MAEETKNIVDKVDEESAVGAPEEANSNPLESEIVDLKQQLEAKELEARTTMIAGFVKPQNWITSRRERRASATRGFGWPMKH